jgi:eukaryotic-like serine/threonine-protein kinase
MSAPATSDAFVEVIQKSGLIAPVQLETYLQQYYSESGPPPEAARFAARLVRDGLLTNFQAQQLLKGRYRNFTLGKYRILEPLGSGGMGKVFLAEHVTMKHRVAMKVLPIQPNNRTSHLARFQREARASGALNHPNIVQTHDLDSDGKNYHYLIMDYVEGVNLFELVRKRGPLPVAAAAQYMAQAAEGLDYIHQAGLIHRDLTPGNLLLDRSGTIKILDLGLARFQLDNRDPITQRFDEKAVLGTADYLAPEQALHASEVDIRADIYSLGATGYYLLTGRPPFEDAKNVTQKLMAHQTRTPEPIPAIRSDVPASLSDLIERMMAKNPGDRLQRPTEVVRALAPWRTTPVPPPAEDDLPRRSPMAKRHSSYTGLAARALASPANGSTSRAAGRLSQSRTNLSIGSPTPVPRHSLRTFPKPSEPPLPERPRWPLFLAGALLLMAVLGAAIWVQNADFGNTPPALNSDSP